MRKGKRYAGYGKESKENGDVFEGLWKEGSKYSGKGKETSKDGTVFEGRWKHF